VRFLDIRLMVLEAKVALHESMPNFDAYASIFGRARFMVPMHDPWA
jgi:hypothetical protein